MTVGTLRRTGFACVAALSVSACSDKIPTAATTDAAQLTGVSTVAWLKGYLGQPRALAAGDPAVLAGAGDIARCYPGTRFWELQPPGPDHPAMLTANLLDGMPGATVMAVGDNAYEFGSKADYDGCYDPTWGRHKSRTRPATGNHEYLTPGAAGYLAYFQERAAPPLYYYSYDLGKWHVVVLNSTPQVYLCWPPEEDELPDFPPQPPPPIPNPAAGRACAGDVAQQAWLINDLTTHDRRCTIAYFHHPRFSSAKHGNHYQMQRIWDILYAKGVDVVVSGHDHVYERFAPQNPDGVADDKWGIRQFTVGTGGAEFYGISTMQPNSEVFLNTVHGVLALALDKQAYAWSFVDVNNVVRDAGSGTCHGAPGV